jgi:hypothetical protein
LPPPLAVRDRRASWLTAIAAEADEDHLHEQGKRDEDGGVRDQHVPSVRRPTRVLSAATPPIETPSRSESAYTIQRGQLRVDSSHRNS